MNERRNPTLCAENRFFSSSFHGFFPRDDSVASGSGGRLALLCILLNLRFSADSIPSALTIFSITCQLSSN